MRINIDSKCLVPEVTRIEKLGNAYELLVAARITLRTADGDPNVSLDNDERSALTFWRPASKVNQELMAQAFEQIATIFRSHETTESIANVPAQTQHRIDSKEFLDELNRLPRPSWMRAYAHADNGHCRWIHSGEDFLIVAFKGTYSPYQDVPRIECSFVPKTLKQAVEFYKHAEAVQRLSGIAYVKMYR